MWFIRVLVCDYASFMGLRRLHGITCPVDRYLMIGARKKVYHLITMSYYGYGQTIVNRWKWRSKRVASGSKKAVVGCRWPYFCLTVVYYFLKKIAILQGKKIYNLTTIMGQFACKIEGINKKRSTAEC